MIEKFKHTDGRMKWKVDTYDEYLKVRKEIAKKLERWITKYVAIRYVRLFGGEISFAKNTYDKTRTVYWLTDKHGEIRASVEVW